MVSEIWAIMGLIVLGLLVDWYFSARDRKKNFGLRGKRDDLLNAD